MLRFRLKSQIVALTALVLTACGGIADLDRLAATGTGRVVVVGNDAPLASVLAFDVTLTSLTLSDGNANVDVLADPARVEFGRLLGLRTLLGLSDLPVGTYTSATLMLDDPSIAYLDLTTTPATVGNLDGLLTQSAVTIPLDPPLVVEEGGLAALHFHFPLHRSLQVDSTGELTGVVDPMVRLRAVPPASEDAFIDELRGGLSTVDLAAGTFTLQRPRGRTITVRVNDATTWLGGETLSTLAAPAIIEVSGHVLNDRSLQAASVEVLTRERFLLGGLVLDPAPGVGPADSANLLVREEVPDLPEFEVGQTAVIQFNDRTRFGMHNVDLPLETFLFNRSSLVRGQRVAAGGRIDDTTTPPTLRIGAVVLHGQGFEGFDAPQSVRINDAGGGIFAMRVGGLYGLLFGGPARVMTTERTRFVNLSGLEELASSDPMRLRVVGFLLRDGNGDPLIVARYVKKPGSDEL